MNLKQRFSIIFSSLFSLLLAAVMLVVYYLFANFRTTEFVERLAEKAEATARLLITVKEIDYQTQKTIDRNSASKLYKENTEIFNEHKQLIYDTEHAIDINWQPSDFDQIVEKKRFFEKKGPYDVVGLAYTYNKHFYYVFISAEDNYGVSKLEYLKYLLLGAFISGTILVWLISFRLSKKSLQPLDDFRRQIQNITDHNLKVRLSVSETKNKDEVNALAKSFNQMMERIDRAYNRQREFTGNASHELRTPVARMAVQIENLIQSSIVPAAVQDQLTEISQDVFQLSEIITSLVALADITRREHDLSFENIRLDEVVFAATAQITKNYPDFLFRFDVENNSGRETDFEIHGDETLLKIVLTNLFKNAYLYSDNHLLECLIIQHKNGLQLQLTNTGQVPDVENTRILFDAFYRGNNSKATAGSGIGLSIVKRVLDYHGAKITYHLIDNQTNQIDIFFPV